MKFKRVSEKDIEKLIELIKDKFATLSKVAISGKYTDLTTKPTAADIGALPLSGGILEVNAAPILSLKRKSKTLGAVVDFLNDSTPILRLRAALRYDDIEGTASFELVDITHNGYDSMFLLSKERKEIYDYKSKTLKEILVQGDIIMPTVKETVFVINNNDLKVEGMKGNNYIDITESFIKSNTYKEGMIVGISSNGMGYVISQNFSIDCSKLTDDERRLMQSLYAIKISKANDSNDYPVLKPGISDREVGFTVRGKNGDVNSTTKLQIAANDSEIYFRYTLPKEFKSDDNSSNLFFGTKEWTTFVGINVREY